MWTWVGPRNHVLNGDSDTYTWRGSYEGTKGWPMRCLDMPGGRYTQSDSAGGSTGTVGTHIGCTRWNAHWHHLMNTIEQFMCCGDAALCQISLNTSLCMELKNDRSIIISVPADALCNRNVHVMLLLRSVGQRSRSVDGDSQILYEKIALHWPTNR